MAREAFAPISFGVRKEQLIKSAVVCQIWSLCELVQLGLAVRFFELNQAVPDHLLQPAIVGAFIFALGVGAVIEDVTLRKYGYCANPLTTLIYHNTNNPEFAVGASLVLTHLHGLVANPGDTTSAVTLFSGGGGRFPLANAEARAMVWLGYQSGVNWLIHSGKVDGVVKAIDRFDQWLYPPKPVYYPDNPKPRSSVWSSPESMRYLRR